MSKHPLGPWTQTKNERNVAPNSGYFVDSRFPNSKTDVSSGFVGGLLEVRTGYNHGGVRPYPPSDATLLKQTGESVGCSGTIDSGFGYAYKHVNMPVDPAITLETNLVDPAQVESIAKLKVLQKQGPILQSLVSAGEFKETLQTGKHIVDTLVGKHNEVYKSLLFKISRPSGFYLRKPSVQQLKEIANIVSNHYLEYKFGIAPTLSDMESLGKAVAQQVGQLNRPTRFMSGWSQDAVKSQIEPAKNAGGWLTWRQVTEYHQTVHCKAGATYRVVGPEYLPDWQTTWGFTKYDVAPAVWELLPYSWLVDYFLNVQEFFDSLSLQRGLLETGWFVTTNDVEIVTSATNLRSSGGPTTSLQSGASPGRGYWRSFSFHRGIWVPDTFSPLIRFKEPDLAQLSNIAAVATTRLLKPKKLIGALQFSPNALSRYF